VLQIGPPIAPFLPIPSDETPQNRPPPLLNAEKTHTPLLLLHGDSDTNVPTSESVNLYNALKVLGREVELIEFTGQDHFILEPERREKWTASIQAWFARFLKDDASWWHQLYDEKK